jgi:hypothetical protein
LGENGDCEEIDGEEIEKVELRQKEPKKAKNFEKSKSNFVIAKIKQFVLTVQLQVDK